MTKSGLVGSFVLGQSLQYKWCSQSSWRQGFSHQSLCNALLYFSMSPKVLLSLPCLTAFHFEGLLKLTSICHSSRNWNHLRSDIPSYNHIRQLWYSLDILTLFLIHSVFCTILPDWPGLIAFSHLLILILILTLFFLLHESAKVSSSQDLSPYSSLLLGYVILHLKTYICYSSPSKL